MPTTRRNPSSRAASAANATMKNGSTTTCPVRALSNMPTSRAPAQMTIPDGQSANGFRHARPANHPAAAPTRKGQAVKKTPVMISPRLWASRPIAAKARMSSKSPAAAGIQDLFGEGMTPTISGDDAMGEAGEAKVLWIFVRGDDRLDPATGAERLTTAPGKSGDRPLVALLPYPHGDARTIHNLRSIHP